MFSVLVIESGAGFFGRRRLFKTPRVRDVRVYGGLPFREITTARRRGKINREAVYAAAGRCAGSMLLPEGTAPGGGISQPDLSDYKKLVFFNTACSLLRSACGCGVRGELLIKDKNASAARRLGIAVPLFSDIRVSTSCPEGYSRPIESAMDEFGAKKAYVLSMLGDDYTVGLAKNFVIAFEAAGGEIVADETFVEGTADFSAYLNNAVSGGADVIFAPSAIAYAPQIIEQASALGVSLPILGGDTWENSAISDAQNGTDMQVFVSTFFDENDESGLAKEFVSGYKAWLNGNSQNLTNNGGNDVVAAVSALGYDAYMTAVAAIEKAQSTDGSAIRDALAGLSIDAVTGSISFDANGDAVKSTAYIKQAIDGGFQFYKVQNAD